jgi:hypothetical protein
MLLWKSSKRTNIKLLWKLLNTTEVHNTVTITFSAITGCCLQPVLRLLSHRKKTVKTRPLWLLAQALWKESSGHWERAFLPDSIATAHMDAPGSECSPGMDSAHFRLSHNGCHSTTGSAWALPNTSRSRMCFGEQRSCKCPHCPVNPASSACLLSCPSCKIFKCTQWIVT